MRPIAPEFSRPVRLDALGSDDRAVPIAANEAERTALTKRLGLLSLSDLSADVALHPGPQGIDARGTMRAAGEQACVVTGEPIAVRFNEVFAVRFVAANTPDEDEIELSEADLDVVEHDGNVIDLGEAVAQTLALALDPFPRGPGAEAKLKEAGVISEGDAGPFGALAGLKAKLEGR
jgi:hypothetical protein